MFSDLSLNVQLEKACNPDILHHCGDARLQALQDHVDGKDPHGVIYECLKEKYASEVRNTERWCVRLSSINAPIFCSVVRLRMYWLRIICMFSEVFRMGPNRPELYVSTEISPNIEFSRRY